MSQIHQNTLHLIFTALGGNKLCLPFANEETETEKLNLAYGTVTNKGRNGTQTSLGNYGQDQMGSSSYVLGPSLLLSRSNVGMFISKFLSSSAIL